MDNERFNINENDCIRCELCMNQLPHIFGKQTNGKSFVKSHSLKYCDNAKMKEVIQNCPMQGISDNS